MKQRKKGWYWPLLIVGLMVPVLGANLALVWVSSSDPSFAVEEDYYRKAIEWDDKRAQDRRNEQLGWQLDFRVAASRPSGETVGIEAELRDAAGRRIPDASVRLATFHNARAALIFRSELRGDGKGGYATDLPLRRPGLWEFRFEVDRGADRFTATTMRELVWQ